MPTTVEAVRSAAGERRPVHVGRQRPADTGDVERFDAVYRVREILLDAARCEVWQRSLSIPQLEANACEELAAEAADAALIAVLARLDEVVEDQSFSTWVSRFAISEAAIRMRRLARQQNGLSGSRGELVSLRDDAGRRAPLAPLAA